MWIRSLGKLEMVGRIILASGIAFHKGRVFVVPSESPGRSLGKNQPLIFQKRTSLD